MQAFAEQRLQVRVNDDGDGPVVEAHGEVDLATAPHLGTILQAVSHRPDAQVVVDLRPTTYLGSAGLTALIAAHRQAATAPSPFEVQVRGGSQPDTILRQAGVHRLFSVVVWHQPSSSPFFGPMGAAHGCLELRIPSCPFQVSRVRHLTEQVLALVNLDDSWIGDFVTAVGEAVANAVTHGSPKGGPGYVVFTLKPSSTLIVAEVQDFGHGIKGWQGAAHMPPPQNLRGRGLGMMQILADSMEVHTGEHGTLVRLSKFVNPGASTEVH